MRDSLSFFYKHAHKHKRAHAYSGTDGRWPCPYNPLWCCSGQQFLNIYKAKAPTKLELLFLLTDPNCQGAVSCQTRLRASLSEGHRFLSLSLLFQFPVSFHLHTTALKAGRPQYCTTISLDRQHFLSLAESKKSEPQQDLTLKPQMAGGGLRGLVLTLLIGSCEQKEGFHCSHCIT